MDNDELRLVVERFNNWSMADYDRSQFSHSKDSDLLAGIMCDRFVADENERIERAKQIDIEWLKSLAKNEKILVLTATQTNHDDTNNDLINLDKDIVRLQITTVFQNGEVDAVIVKNMIITTRGPLLDLIRGRNDA